MHGVHVHGMHMASIIEPGTRLPKTLRGWICSASPRLAHGCMLVMYLHVCMCARTNGCMQCVRM